MNSERKFIPSIFCDISNKPKENSYPDKLCFDPASINNLHTVSYPLSCEASRELDDFPEKTGIDSAKKKCREKATGEDNPYLLVSGDLSGIQDTVFTISSKGALKSLRARSFMLELLCEHICYELVTACVVDDYKANRGHVIFSGGGRFCLLLPNNRENIDCIKHFRRVINDWAFEEFAGKLYVAISYIELDDNDIDKNRFGDTWQKLSDKLGEDKRQKFRWKLHEIFGASYPVEPRQKKNQEECQVCHRDDIDLSVSPMRTLDREIIDSEDKLETAGNDPNKVIVHEMCYRLYKLGDRLTDFEYISRVKNKPSGDGYLIFKKLDGSDIYYVLEEATGSDCVWRLNSSDENYIPFFYANYVRKVSDLPLDAKDKESQLYSEEHNNKKMERPEETTASFTGLANAACGADLIACLRMDVDDLGKIFSEHLSRFDLVTLAHLSRMLNLFFKVYLNKICAGELGTDDSGSPIKPTDLTGKRYTEDGETEEDREELKKRRGEKGRNVSVIYAGGDDLFIVGAWDEVAELAYDIQACFARFSGLGISGGLTLHKAKFPLYQMARLSGEAEREAKKFKLEDELKPVKNKYAIFYTPYYRHKASLLNDTAKRHLREDATDFTDKLMYAIQWEDKTSIDLVRKFVSFCDRKEGRLDFKDVSKGFLYKLFHIAEVWWERKTLYVPQFIYLIERMSESLGDKHKTNVMDIRDQIIKMPIKDSKHRTIRFIKIPLTWIELLQRNKGV